MNNVFIIVSVNGNEEKINLIENPSARKTEGKRFVLADYAGKNVKTFLNGKYFYINLPENKTKEKKQTSRKTVSETVKDVPETVQETETAEITQVSAIETLRILFAQGKIKKTTYENRLKVLQDV